VPRVLTITQSTYDGIVYNVEMIKSMLDGKVDSLHFDEAWLPHAAFHPFYQYMHAIGQHRKCPQKSLLFSTQSTHKLLAAAALCRCNNIRNTPPAGPFGLPRRYQGPEPQERHCGAHRRREYSDQ